MNTEELIEWHTKKCHWRFLTVEEDRQNRDDPIGITHDSWVQKIGFFPSVRRSPPFPATIDGAASAMPKGWEYWKIIDDTATGFTTWYWAGHPVYQTVKQLASGDEVHDRYALAKYAWEAMADPK